MKARDLQDLLGQYTSNNTQQFFPWTTCNIDLLEVSYLNMNKEVLGMILARNFSSVLM